MPTVENFTVDNGYGQVTEQVRIINEDGSIVLMTKATYEAQQAQANSTES